MVSQGAMMTVDCYEHSRLRKQQPTIFIDVDQPHQQLQMCEMPTILLFMTLQQQCQQYDNHSFYCHIAMIADNNRQTQGKNEYYSHATIKYYMLSFAGCNDNYIAPCYDQQCKYAEVGDGKYPRDGVYTTRGVYIAGKYIKYAKDVMYVAEGKYG
jgi:hypothetical protein